MARPGRPCVERCPNLAQPGSSRCLEHQRQRQRAYNQQRPARHKFYSSNEWVKFRDQVLLERGRVCSSCGSQSNIVLDHIINIKQRWDLRLDRDNVQALCGPCHSKKTALTDHRWG